jgi:hypothetical protein
MPKETIKSPANNGVSFNDEQDYLVDAVAAFAPLASLVLFLTFMLAKSVFHWISLWFTF